MNIRTRLTLWFGAVLFLSLLAMGVLSYYELVAEQKKLPVQSPDPKDEDSEAEGASDVLGILAWCGVPSLVVGLGGGWWLMRKALAPVTALTQAAERVNEHNLNERIPRTNNGDELDRLSDVFNRMTERLNQSFLRIREFTLHASHELKTPLTVMHGELETALRQSNLPAEQRERLESELDEVQRLTKIVDGLTLLTKADAGQIALVREPVRLDELLREACADAESLARPQDIKINLQACDELTVTADRHRLRQLLLILTDNAIKYNQHKGSVTLALRRVADAAELTVANTGPGITPGNLPRVFDPFFRGDPSHHQTEGCGLGLSIARWLATAHNGTIQITSAPGGLTTATVRLPLSVNHQTKKSKYNMKTTFSILVCAVLSTGALAAENKKPFTDSFNVNKSDLSSVGTNQYFVLTPGYYMVLEGKEKGKKTTLTVIVLDETKMVDGVETRVVEEKETVGDQPAEVSRNFFAISKRSGDLFYFGEEVDIYKGGKVVNHEGAWQSGVGGAHFGLFLPGMPLLGARYYQEVAPKVAMDRAEIVSLSETLDTPAGKFDKCLKSEETSEIERGREYKIFAPGIGLIYDGELKLTQYGYGQK